MNALTANDRQPQVKEWFNHLMGQIDQIQIRLDTLHERLSPVLRSSLCESPTEGKTEQALVPLADHLRNQVRRLERITTQLDTILDGTEL